MGPCAYDGQALVMMSHMHDELHEKQLVCNLNEQMITPLSKFSSQSKCRASAIMFVSWTSQGCFLLIVSSTHDLYLPQPMSKTRVPHV
jgi:hypothetical protein